MKKSSKLFGLLLLFALVFASCSSDDHEDPKEKRYFDGECKHEVTLRALKDQTTSTLKNPSIIKLDEMLPTSIYNYIPPVISGEFVPRETTVEIVGLEEGCILSDFSLTINGKTQNWNDAGNLIGFNNAQLYTSATSAYFTDVFNLMISQKGFTITMSYGSNKDILNNDVKLIIKYSGRFAYYQKL